MTEFRQETDLLGTCNVPADALWGIHTLRAVENFPLACRPVHRGLVHAYGAVKLAAARTNHELGWWVDAENLSQGHAGSAAVSAASSGQDARAAESGIGSKFAAIEAACREMIDGKLDEQIIVDALQGGAGTSTNMNVNEVLANRALQLLGRPPGEYHTINPHDDINLHQSTNDTYPTALRIAAIYRLRQLEQKLVALLEAFQQKEKQFADVVKIGRTELQDAVLVTLGREMGAYAEAVSRDRWRIYKCEEHLRVVNLGGTAVGTGLGAPRQYIFRVVQHLKDVTGLGLARAENLVEATQNADVFVEVSGIVRTLAANLLKIANDLRLLSSGPHAGLAEIRLPPRQAGSSIMPGKVNPVIPEAVAQAAIAVMGHDQAILQAASGGNLELNQFLPLLADSLLRELDLLTNTCDIFARLCVSGIEADVDQCRRNVHNSTATLTALIERIGYESAEHLAEHLDATKGDPQQSIRRFVVEHGMMTAEEFDELTAPERVMRLGSTAVTRPKTPLTAGERLVEGAPKTSGDGRCEPS